MRPTGEDPDSAQRPPAEPSLQQLAFEQWCASEGLREAEAIAAYLARPGEDPSLAASLALEDMWRKNKTMTGWSSRARYGWLANAIRHELGDQRRTAYYRTRSSPLMTDGPEEEERRAQQDPRARRIDDEVIESNHMNDLLKLALANSSDTEKLSFFLEYFAGFSRAEVAKQLRIPKWKVRSMNERTKQRVQNTVRGQVQP